MIIESSRGIREETTSEFKLNAEAHCRSFKQSSGATALNSDTMKSDEARTES